MTSISCTPKKKNLAMMISKAHLLPQTWQTCFSSSEAHTKTHIVHLYRPFYSASGKRSFQMIVPGGDEEMIWAWRWQSNISVWRQSKGNLLDCMLARKQQEVNALLGKTRLKPPEICRVFPALKNYFWRPRKKVLASPKKNHQHQNKKELREKKITIQILSTCKCV